MHVAKNITHTPHTHNRNLCAPIVTRAFDKNIQDTATVSRAIVMACYTSSQAHVGCMSLFGNHFGYDNPVKQGARRTVIVPVKRARRAAVIAAARLARAQRREREVERFRKQRCGARPRVNVRAQKDYGNDDTDITTPGALDDDLPSQNTATSVIPRDKHRTPVLSDNDDADEWSVVSAASSAPSLAIDDAWEVVTHVDGGNDAPYKQALLSAASAATKQAPACAAGKRAIWMTPARALDVQRRNAKALAAKEGDIGEVKKHPASAAAEDPLACERADVQIAAIESQRCGPRSSKTRSAKQVRERRSKVERRTKGRALHGRRRDAYDAALVAAAVRVADGCRGGGRKGRRLQRWASPAARAALLVSARDAAAEMYAEVMGGGGSCPKALFSSTSSCIIDGMTTKDRQCKHGTDHRDFWDALERDCKERRGASREVPVWWKAALSGSCSSAFDE